MSNSKLVNYTKLSPNCNKPRNHAIDTITIHHMAGNLTVEQCGAIFAPTSRRASSNYGVDTDGRVGLYVDEANRSWCSSSSANDHRAITIEVANDEVGGNWHVGDKAMAKLIDLCVDICKRNGIAKLNYTGDKSGNLTMHKWFAATACPGPYLESKFPYIAQQVNAKLAVAETPPAPEPATPLKPGDLVKITGSTYYGGKTIPAWVKAKNWYIRSLSGDRVVIDKSEDGMNAICSPVKASDLSVATVTFRVHTVVHGDTLWAIAKKYLGSGSRYKEIVTLNGLKSNVIYSGQKLKIPN